MHAADAGLVHAAPVTVRVEGPAVVQDAAVVPDQQITKLPLVAVDVFRPDCTIEQVVEQLTGLLVGPALD